VNRKNTPREGQATSLPADPVYPDLVRIVTAWPNLPPANRRAIQALVESADHSE
jgi:hypothetical protein